MPPNYWKCYTSTGAAAANNSSMYSKDGFDAVPIYMLDQGNDKTFGNRRRILSNKAPSTIGIGSTNSYSCLQIKNPYNTNLGTPREWTAWPPPGKAIPLQAANVDSSGWTIQSDDIDLSTAKVTITEAGKVMPVTVNQLDSGYGSQYAISIVPEGWTSKAGSTYHVSVTEVAKPFEYSVSFLDCP